MRASAGPGLMLWRCLDDPVTDPSPPDTPDDPALTTREAARLLGVSVGTVQKWVESGELSGWKTPGGHRRVRWSAVAGMLSLSGSTPGRAADPAEFVPEPRPAYPVSAEEPARLAAVRRSGLLDSPADPALDRIAWLASAVTDTPVALLTVLSNRRQWFKARVGLDVVETPRSWAFCSYTVLQGEVFLVEDASNDARFANNPLVTGSPHIRFYAGAPLRDASGFALGALCAIDTQPRRLSPTQVRAILELAQLASDRLEK